MGEVIFYAYREGGSVRELERQFFEATEYLGYKTYGSGEMDTEGGDLVLYDVQLNERQAREVIDYLQNNYPNSYWEATGYPDWSSTLKSRGIGY